MEHTLIVMLVCIFCFLCGAGVVYARDWLFTQTEKVVEEEESIPDDKMRKQWVEFLNYNGNAGE